MLFQFAVNIYIRIGQAHPQKYSYEFRQRHTLVLWESEELVSQNVSE